MTTEKVRPLDGTQLANVPGLDKGYYVPADGYELTDDLDAAMVTTSLIPSEPAADGAWQPIRRRYHKLVVDLDLPAKLLPSSTEGHFHLYVDHPIEDYKYWNLIRAMVDAGLVEKGFLNASEQRGFTAVRLPWVKKPEQVDA